MSQIWNDATDSPICEVTNEIIGKKDRATHRDGKDALETAQEEAPHKWSW